MNKKKLIAIISMIVAVAIIYFGIRFFLTKPETGNKTIYITLIDQTADEDNTLIDNKAFKTDALTFYEFLDEEKKELKIIFGDSGFGHTVDEIYGLAGDMSSANGPWILYESPNNKSCVANGYCLGVDELAIFDDDSFIFKFTSEMMFE